MSLYQRYLFRQIMWPFLFAALGLAGAVWLSQSLRFVDLIVNQGVSVWTFLFLTMLLLPSLMLVVIPSALLTAVILAYNRMIGNNELTALQVAHIGPWGLAKPAMFFGIVASLACYLCALYLSPLAYRSFKDLEHSLTHELSALLLQERVFNTPVEGLTVYVRDRDATGGLRGILLHDNRDPQRPETMLAESGFLLQGPDGPSFVLNGGNRQEIDLATGQMSLLYFDRYRLDLHSDLGDGDLRYKKPAELFIHELLFPDNPALSEKQRLRFIAEGHNQLTWPLTGLTLTLISLAVLLPRQARRHGQHWAIALAVMLSIAVLAAILAAKSTASKAPALIPLMYLAQIVPMFLAIRTLTASDRVQSQPIVLDRQQAPS